MQQNTRNVAHISETPMCNKRWTIYRETSVLVTGEAGRLESHIPSYHGNLAARAGKAQSFT